MAEESLRWKPAVRIAWREVRASKAKFAFVIFSVAVGVAALTGVRGFSDAFHRALLKDARTLMAADLSVRMPRQPSREQLDRLRSVSFPGIERAQVSETRVTEMLSMASSPENPVPLLVSMKAVNPEKYPFYGRVVIDGTLPGEPSGFAQALTDSTVLVDDSLLVRLNTSVGAPLKIGNTTFRIAGIIRHEPDRISSVMPFGPRVLITQSALKGTGLLQPGTHAAERFLFKLPPGANVELARTSLERALPEAQVLDYRQANPALASGLKRSTALLSLICLVSLVLGAIGVGMAMRAHLDQRIEILAILKSIGARSSSILEIYLIQTLLLGLMGGLIGVGLGLAVQRALPALMGGMLVVPAGLHFFIGPAAAGLGAGILTTVLFCLPPLLNIRKVPPSLVLRRMVEQGGHQSSLPANRGVRARARRLVIRVFVDGWPQWVLPGIILAGLAAIAAELSGSASVGRWFAVAICALLAAAFVLSAVSLHVLRVWLENSRRMLHSSVRQGLANLYRPGNQSAALLAALALGVMLVLAVFLMERSIVLLMEQTIAPNVPNVFLIDISENELQSVERFLGEQPEVSKTIEKLPVVQGIITEVDGVPAATLRREGKDSRRLLQTVPFTSSATLPKGSSIVKGSWWRSDDGRSLAITPWVASGLHLKLGSKLTFLVQGRTIHARVSAIVKHDGNHVYARSGFIFTPSALAGLHDIWYAGIHVETGKVGQFEGAFFRAHPTITIINVADLLSSLQGILRTVSTVIRFLAAFSILAGIIILASSVAGTRMRRIREVVIFKVLGAKKGHIIAVFSVEFLLLGLLAGVVGAIFANWLAHVLLARMDVEYQIDWQASAIAILATMALAVASGWLSSFRILGQRPMEVLREE